MMVAMGDVIVVTGPPGAGKSTVAQRLVDMFDPSALVAGDEFFGFLRNGAISPWLDVVREQNNAVNAAAAAATGRLASHCDVVYDGAVGPWVLRSFLETAELQNLHYVVLLPPLTVCLQRVHTLGATASPTWAPPNTCGTTSDEPTSKRDMSSKTTTSSLPGSSAPWRNRSRKEPSATPEPDVLRGVARRHIDAHRPEAASNTEPVVEQHQRREGHDRHVAADERERGAGPPAHAVAVAPQGRLPQAPCRRSLQRRLRGLLRWVAGPTSRSILSMRRRRDLVCGGLLATPGTDAQARRAVSCAACLWSLLADFVSRARCD